MHPSVLKLYQIAEKESRKIIGLMSGTSMDGLDIALCTIKGAGLDTILTLEAFTSVPFDKTTKANIQSVFSKDQISLEQLTLLNPWLATEYAKMVRQALSVWGISLKEIDLIASHGQTVFHAPKTLHATSAFGNGTLQIGDGDHLAVELGVITISDFRQKHIAAGGEGAPLVVYGDYILYRSRFESRVLLNIGGIANFTYLPANCTSEQVVSTDTGPGNTLMDAYIRKHFPQLPFDQGGKMASQGKVHFALLEQMKKDAFFTAAYPKTIGPELFNLAFIANAQAALGLLEITHEDMMATLNYFTAITIVQAIEAIVPKDQSIVLLISGGGLHNHILVEHIQSLLPHVILKDTNAIGVAPDAKEAVLFALLANETVAGEAMQLAQQTKIPVTFGKISFPD